METRESFISRFVINEADDKKRWQLTGPPRVTTPSYN